MNKLYIMKFTKREKQRLLNRNKVRKTKTKKSGSYKDYKSDLDIDELLLNKSEAVGDILDKKQEKDKEDINNIVTYNSEIIRVLDSYPESIESMVPLAYQIPNEIRDIYKNVFSETVFGIELELCIKINNELFLKEIEKYDKQNIDIRKNLISVLNHKTRALIDSGSWNYYLSRKEIGTRIYTEPSGEYSFVIDDTKDLSGKKWTLIDDISIICDVENDYYRTELVSPVLKMGETDKDKYPEDVWNKITDGEKIDYDEGIEVVKNILETVLKTKLEADSISEIGGIQLQEPICSADEEGKNSCGTHVHISNKYMTGNSRLGKLLFWNLCRYWYFFEPTINTLLSPDRYINFYSLNMPRSRIKDKVFDICNIDKMKWIIDNMSLTEIANLFIPPSDRGRKYYKINLNFVRAACRNKSSEPLRVEIRAYQGSSDFSEIRNWIYLSTRFISNSITSSLLSLTPEEAIFLDIPEREIETLIGDGFLKGDKSYFINKFSELSEGDDFINMNTFNRLFNVQLLNIIRIDEEFQQDISLKKYYYNKIKQYKSHPILVNSRSRELRAHKRNLDQIIEEIESDEDNKSWIENDIVYPELWGQNINGNFVPNDDFMILKNV